MGWVQESTERGFSASADIILKLYKYKKSINFDELPIDLRYDLKNGQSKMKILKTIYLNLMITTDYNKLFIPELTPQEMLEAGVFGGNYFKDNVAEFPAKWFKDAKINYNEFDVSLNYFSRPWSKLSSDLPIIQSEHFACVLPDCMRVTRNEEFV